MKKYILIVVCFVFFGLTYYYFQSATPDQANNDSIETLQSVSLNHDFTNFIYEGKQFESNRNFQKIATDLSFRKGIILVSKNLDFMFDNPDNINYVFIPLKDNTIELKEENGDYKLVIHQSSPINTIASGDKGIFKLMQEINSMIVSYTIENDYYFPIYQISKDTLLANTQYSFITYNLSLTDLKILNKDKTIVLPNHITWNKEESKTLDEIRQTFNENL